MINTTIKKRLGTRPAAHGFTLMEMLVAITVFAMLIATASDIFMMASRSQRKIFDLQAMQASSRFTMDAIVREIRTGRIDYDYYSGRDENGLQLQESELALIDSEDMSIRFYESDETNGSFCLDEQSAPCLLVSVGSYDPAPLSPRGVKVQSARFFVSPSSDPMSFDPIVGYSSDQQPSVTILLSLESVGRKSGERTYMDLQTTATSRVYVR